VGARPRSGEHNGNRESTVIARRPILLVVLALAALMFIVTAELGGARAASTGVVIAQSPPDGEAGPLVSLDDLCAFRAPLAFTGAGEVPNVCAATVAWLRAVAAHDPACADRWIESGAVPSCASRYRPDTTST